MVRADWQLRAGSGFPIEYFTSPDGDDSNSGHSPEEAFRSVVHAVDQLAAGDHLFLRGGTYLESVKVEHLDASGAPVVIESFPGELVVIDGP